MAHSNTTLQVILATEGRPTRIVAERPLESGRAVVTIQEGDAPMERLSSRARDVVRVDLRLPQAGGDGAGLQVQRERRVDAEEVVVTDAPVPLDETYAYLTRPLDLAEVRRMATLSGPPPAFDSTLPPAPQWARDPDAPILGSSAAMADLWRTVGRVADASASVLIQGETGSGKGLVARAIHRASPRQDRPFVVINCGAFQDHLLESELFGHEKGAFTGALVKKPGLFEVADGGTLFLDEVAEMSPAMQAKLLLVLDSGELRRVGGTRTTRVDTRLIAASNKHLEAEVEAGRFRRDLFFRLNVVTLSVPPLRQRREDIPPLVAGFLERFRRPGEPAKRVTAEALALMMRYAWPGNVRELANTIEGLTLLAPGPSILREDLPPSLRQETATPVLFDEPTSEPVSLRELERQHITRALAFTEGKKAPAARLLGIDIKTLNSKIQAYRIVN